MSKRNASFRLIIILIFAIAELTGAARVAFAQTLTLGQTAGAGVGAQSFDDPWQLAQAVLDVEPPLIEHEPVPESDANIRQTFVATVVDDQELDLVQLFYRFKGESRYTRTLMNRVSFSSTWIAQIATDPATPMDMEYYIEAKDNSGNRTVHGFAFSPLVRKIIPAEVAEPVVEQPEASPKPAISNSRKVLYVVGGVLLLGLVAAAASGGSDSGSDPPDGETCTGGSCTVTISTVRPF